ncbi:MAG: hypothetical protein DDT27_01635 [Dehalococcoidia bacterium]|nr:hypothetical protein [Chloroflexota bacterium]
MGEGVPLRVEIPLPVHHVGEDLVPKSNRVLEGRFRRYRHVQILGIDDNVPHRPLYPADLAADDLHPDIALECHLRNLPAHDSAVAGIHHLVGGRKVRPELEPPHEAVGVTLWHFLVDDAATGGHPLDVARGDAPLVPHAVAVLYAAVNDVGDRFDPPVRVPGKPFQIIRGMIRMEVVKHEEGVEQGDLIVAEGPFQMDAGPLDGWLAFPNFADLAHGFHIFLQWRY